MFNMKRLALLSLTLSFVFSTEPTFADSTAHMWVKAKNPQLRSEPSFLGKVLMTLSYGTKVDLMPQGDDSPNGWRKVRIIENSMEGWISRSALGDEPVATLTPKVENTPNVEITVPFLKPQPADEQEIANYMLEYIRDGDLRDIVAGVTSGKLAPSVLPEEIIVVCFPVAKILGNGDEQFWTDWADHANPKRMWVWTNGSIRESAPTQEAVDLYIQKYISNELDTGYRVSWGLLEFGVESVSADQNYARIYYSGSFGPLFGWGSLLTLHSEQLDEWKVVSSISLWRS